MGRRAVLLVAVAALVLPACAGGRDTNEVVTSTQHRTVVINDEPTPLCVAVAKSLAEQINGLAHRPSIPPKEGMAFLFGDAAPQSFDMRDVPFPLSIVWVGDDSKVLGSTAMAPEAPNDYDSPGPITLAVELSPQDWTPLAGTARTLSLGEVCPGTITAGRPGKRPTRF